jgi:hypothetical protein
LIRKKYSNSKLFWMGFLGLIAALFFLLASLHEFWHALFSLLHGYIPEVTWTGVYSDNRSISMSLAGPFGELLSFGAIFVYAIWKEKLYLAVFMTGYMIWNLISFSIPGWMPVDFQIAIGYTNKDWLVIFLFWICRFMNYAWEIIAVVTIRKLKKYLEKQELKVKPNTVSIH